MLEEITITREQLVRGLWEDEEWSSGDRGRFEDLNQFYQGCLERRADRLFYFMKERT